MKHFTGIIVAALAIGIQSAAAAAATSSVSSSSSSSIPSNDKHPLEDRKSWDLHVGRQLSSASAPLSSASASASALSSAEDITADTKHPRRKALQTFVDAAADVVVSGDGYEDVSDYGDNSRPYRFRHKKQKKHVLFAGGETTHGIMIDAGSVSFN